MHGQKALLFSVENEEYVLLV